MSGGNLVAVLGEESSLNGRFVGQDLTVLGRFEGDLKASGVVRIGRQAEVKAAIDAGAVEIEGAFEGRIKAARLFISSTARASGTFLADLLLVQDGAVVDGSVNLPPVAESVDVDVAVPAPATAKMAEEPGASATSEAVAEDEPHELPGPGLQAELPPYVALSSPGSASVTYAAAGLISTPSWEPHPGLHAQRRRHRRRRHM